MQVVSSRHTTGRAGEAFGFLPIPTRSVVPQSIRILLLVAITFCACGGRKDDAVQAGSEQEARPPVDSVPLGAGSGATAPAQKALASVVRTGEESVASQLLRGFYQIEAGSWRWTAPNFSVELAVPSAAASKGGVLRMNFSVPEALIAQHQVVDVRARVGDVVTSRKVSGAGAHALELELPPAALSHETVVADFAVDQPFLPSGADRRSLGVVAISFELLSK
jgi:hypothetical protein